MEAQSGLALWRSVAEEQQPQLERPTRSGKTSCTGFLLIDGLDQSSECRLDIVNLTIAFKAVSRSVIDVIDLCRRKTMIILEESGKKRRLCRLLASERAVGR